MPPFNPSLVFHDVDGCLNPADGEDFGPPSRPLSASQRKSLEAVELAVHRAGAGLIFNTGRSLDDTLHIFEAMPKLCLRYGLFEHSAYGYDFSSQRRIELADLANEQGDEERKTRYGQLAWMDELNHWFREEGSQLLEARTGHRPILLEKSANLSLECPTGVPISQYCNSLRDLVREKGPDAGGIPVHFCHSAFFVDVLASVHKSDGAILLARDLGVDLERCLVVGDGMNDVEIFEAFPRLLCPSNADEELRRVCRSKGGTCSPHPYSEAILHHLQEA